VRKRGLENIPPGGKMVNEAVRVVFDKLIPLGIVIGP
jgi:hypothetical protein